MAKKKVKKKGFIVIILTLYLIIMTFYYAYMMPVKNIIVKDNNIVSDNEIINLANINNNTKLFFMNTNKVIRDIKSNPIVNDVKIKRWFNGDVTIIIKENKILFYNVLKKVYVLSNGVESENVNINGIPNLINYVPDDIYKGLINKMSEIDSNIISYISEIEYSPLQILDKDKNENITVDDERFLLRMNDKNHVYINLPNFEKLSKYEEYYAEIGEDKKGTFLLDSKSDNVIHKLFE